VSEKVNILKLTLHGHLIAYLAGFQNGRNVLRFTEDFRANQHRPTFSLITQSLGHDISVYIPSCPIFYQKGHYEN
jgi:hypothetical protein